MSDENSEADGSGGPEGSTPTTEPSIFDLFEPPPEVDSDRFGPIPVVSPEGVGPGDSTGEMPVEGQPQSVDELLASDTAEELNDAADDSLDDDALHEDALHDDALHDDALHDDALPGGDDPDPAEGSNLITLNLDPSTVEATASERGLAAQTSESEGLQDWTAPATGQVPAVLDSAKGDTGWSDLDGPRWHGEDPEWGSEDLNDVFGGLEGVAEPSDMSFDDIAVEDEPIPTAAGAPQRADRQAQRPARVRQRPSSGLAAGAAAEGGERNLGMAIGVGVALVVIALVAINVESDIPLLLIVTIAAAAGASEFYLQLRKNGLHPATLLGITATASVPLSVNYRGEAAYPMVIALTIIFGALWYIVGADFHKPALNMSLTLFGVGWVGVLGSFAVLLFTAPGDGHGLLLAAILVAVASDTGAYAFGRMVGTRPFHSASKNKTWEGTIGGVITAVVAGLVLFVLEATPFGSVWWHAALLGFVGGVLGPIGDLTESIIKRDLGVKDMGTLIPGHGGVLDRIDGLLFVLPGVYYLAVMIDLV